MQSTVKCPTGMIIEVRGLTGADGRYMSNEKLVRNNQVQEFVLKHCVEKVVELPSFYKFGSHVDWDKVLVGDATISMLGVRMATYPDDLFVIPLRCPRSMCEKKFEWELDLEEFLSLKTQPLSSQAREMLERDGHCSFESKTIGKTVKYKPVTLEDMKRYQTQLDNLKMGSQRNKERLNKMVLTPGFWNTHFEGVDRKWDARQDFLESLGLGELVSLRKELEAFDCGIDTDIQIECPHCDLEFEVTIPFDRREAFSPSGRKRKTKDQASPNGKETQIATTATTSPTAETTTTVTTPPQKDPFEEPAAS